MELDVERAKELIEQKLAEEEEEEVGLQGRRTFLGCSRNPHCTLSILRDSDVRRLALTLPSWGIMNVSKGSQGHQVPNPAALAHGAGLSSQQVPSLPSRVGRQALSRGLPSTPQTSAASRAMPRATFPSRLRMEAVGLLCAQTRPCSARCACAETQRGWSTGATGRGTDEHT